MSDEKPKKRKNKVRKPPLSAQDIAFARLLFKRGKKTVAECYLEAGFPAKDTPRATEMAAHRRVKNREFLNFYHTLQNRVAKAAQLDAELVISLAMDLAQADRLGMFDERGCLLPKHLWPDDVRNCLEGVEIEEVFEVVSEKGQPKRKERTGTIRKVKTASRGASIRLLAEVLKIVGRDSEAEQMIAEIERLRRRVLEQNNGDANPN